MHPKLRNIGHRYFPYLVVPYRKVRFKILDILAFKDEIREIRGVRDKAFTIECENSDIYDEFYHDGPAGDNVAEGAVFMVDGRLYHGGPSDRLRGILTTYDYLKKKGIPLYIHWVYPFRLEDYLVPAGKVDWRISEEQLSYSREDSFPVVIMETERPQTHLVNRLLMKMAVRKARRQTHVYSNADNSKGRYRELYGELFKPSPMLEAEVQKHLKAIGADYWVFTFRFLNLLGDFVEHDNTVLSPDERAAMLDKVLAEFRKLAADVPAGHRILVTSDSATFLEFMRDKDERIYIVPGDVKNIDLAKGEHRNAWLKTFTDQQLIMHAERVFLLKTGRMYKSGFPRFAAEIGGKPFVYHKF